MTELLKLYLFVVGFRPGLGTSVHVQHIKDFLTQLVALLCLAVKR